MRTLLFALALASGAAAQPLTPFPAPERASEGVCTQHEALRVCRAEANGEATIRVDRGAQRLARWPVAAGVQAGDFAAFEADLDRDGERDLIVATQEAVSNGLAVAYWRVDVLASGTSGPAYSFTVEDFDASGQSFAHDGARLVLWATDWISGPDPRGRRPEGMYVVGRPFYLASGGLVPARGLPLRARRLLHSFSRDAGEGPVGWLSDRRAESLRTDLALAGCRQSSREVTVGSAETREDEQGEAYTALSLGGGELIYTRGAYVPDAEAITHLGDAASGRLFPPDYAPPGLPDRLKGPRRLTTCASGDWVQARVLWM
ncbi:hypothetical protein [Rubricoccus marinus]|uniref:VCBS repeat-containing protein n=1 Tax=Rubricoccus marinus TaxID=716817 RepID=A0A259TUU9_9BACT|nr:hypothetical protein [Rubricoccus marinus]OZC01535.1 hypothetical protein BSZ36_00160 [Rubricoccus marinus]